MHCVMCLIVGGVGPVALALVDFRGAVHATKHNKGRRTPNFLLFLPHTHGNPSTTTQITNRATKT